MINFNRLSILSGSAYLILLIERALLKAKCIEK